MHISFPFEQLKHVPEIYRREFPSDHLENWFISSLNDKILNRENFENRNILVRVLEKQYEGIAGEKSSEAIHKLKNNNSFTVTTGHQLNIFGGPLFFFYKIISTIRLAEDLGKRFPEKEFIPVFWMATEDHDFEEIKTIHLFGKNITWETDQQGAVGRFITRGMPSLIDELDSMKGNFSDADELIEIFRKSYSGENTLAQATRIFINEIFGEDGLLVIDGDDADLKKILIPVIKKEITEQQVEKIVNDKNVELKEEGFDAQVHPRGINFFYLVEQSRKRIIQSTPGSYSVYEENKEWRREELLYEIEQHPEQFSPNVLLRPIFQEMILPNIAYIGGPGEISYWKQLEEVFSYFGVTYPVLIPRHSALVLEQSVLSKMNKLGISEEDLFLSTDDLIRRYIDSVAGDEIHLDEFRESLKELFDQLSLKAEKTDPTLKAGVLAELHKELKYIESLEGKLRKAEKQKNETALNQLRHIKEKLFPNHIPQERFDSVVSFYWKYGRTGIQFLKENFDSFDLRFRIVYG